jgi:ATP-dependent RNA helicase DeaD
MTQTELFSDLPAPIAKALAERGFTELTAVQQAVVDAESAGRDLRVSSQTGSGKTVAIGIALAAHFLERPAEASPRSAGDSAAHPRALVIVPTRELAAQVREELKWLFAALPGATVEVVTGGTSILRERIALSRRPAFVVGTPGRLLDHMRNGALACNAIEHVILDEADQMLDMGFKDELDEILAQLPEKRMSHLVSATFPHAVKALADRFQKDPLTLEGTKPGDAHPDIQHIAYTIRRHETYAALVNVLLLAGDSRCLLFVNRRVDATELAEKLAADGFGAAPFSGELPQAQRTRTLAAFRSGMLPILVSTDVAARGIDVPDISTVIHVDPPRNSAAYVHRSGRTGRAGRSGRSILLVLGTEARKVGRMLQTARVAASWQAVPRPEQVQKALHKQARKLLFERLAESTPDEAQRMAAKQLLEERDPIEIVAALLEMATPKPPRPPMDVVGLDPFSDDRPGKRGRPERGERGERSERGDWNDRAPRERRDARETGPGFGREERPSRGEKFEKRAPGPRTERPASGGFTPFSVSWGEEGGASAARLLSHVCRRGGLESTQVGAIRVFGDSSVIEIASDVAEAFAAKVAQPDERDPGIAITQGSAGAPSGFEAARPRPAAKRRPEGEERAPFAERRGPKKPFKPGRAPREERPFPRSAGVPGSRPTGPRSAGPRAAGPRPSGPRSHAPRVQGEASGAPDRKSSPKHARKAGPKAAFKPGGAKPGKPFKKSGIAGPPKARRKAGPGGPSGSPKR